MKKIPGTPRTLTSVAPPVLAASHANEVPRAPLNVDAIARAALALIDRDGLEGCSMRRIGRALGVEAMALYHHLPNKGKLLDAVMDLLVDEIEVPPPQGRSVLERIGDAVRNWRSVSIRHPRAFVLLATRRFNSPRAFAFYEQVLALFYDVGLDARASAHWFRLFGSFASGHALSEVASREQVSDPTPLVLERTPAVIPFPRVRAVAPHLRIDRLDEVFEFGLQTLLDALERAAPARPPDRQL